MRGTAPEKRHRKKCPEPSVPRHGISKQAVMSAAAFHSAMFPLQDRLQTHLRREDPLLSGSLQR